MKLTRYLWLAIPCLCICLPLSAQDPLVPTKSEEEMTPLPVDLLPTADAELAPSVAEPFQSLLPGPAQMPDFPAIYAPAGGAAMPEIPDIPGLAPPKVSIRSQDQVKEDQKKLLESIAKGTAPAGPTPLLAAARMENIRSPREARKRSIAERRPMIFVMGGFGWSPPCRALNTDILGNQAFQNMARQNNVILSVLNVPSKKASQDPQKLAEWNAIANYRSFLKVKGLPTIIMFDPDGKELGRTSGYNFNAQNRYGSWLDRMNTICKTIEGEHERLEKLEEKRKSLREVQHYRDWTSNQGTKLFAKISGQTEIPEPTEADPEATITGVLLMDESGKERRVRVSSLSPLDQEFLLIYWAEREAAQTARSK